eukprot:scaffold22742_cov139-Cylindrotheca_fusiformis.AAC.7
MDLSEYSRMESDITQELDVDEQKTTNSFEMEENKEEEEKAGDYAIGDHVCTWISYMGVPFHHQNHGIVVNAIAGDSIVLVLFQKQTRTEDFKEEGCDYCMVRRKVDLEEAKKKWFRIPYGVKWTKRMFTRAGTANPTTADPSEEALSRVFFLWKNSGLLNNLTVEATDEKHISECIVVWCKTGKFYSYHALAKLGHPGADMDSNANLAGGICTQVVASSVAPFMVPVCAVYDIASTVQSWRATHKCQTEWRRITLEWNDKYSITKHLRGGLGVSSFDIVPSQPIPYVPSNVR